MFSDEKCGAVNVYSLKNVLITNLMVYFCSHFITVFLTNIYIWPNGLPSWVAASYVVIIKRTQLHDAEKNMQ